MANTADPASLRQTLLEDAGWWAYRWLYRPMLVLQLVLYARAVVAYLGGPAFALVGGAADPQLHQNHIGNYSILNGQPHPALLGVHLFMALGWVAAVLFQKHAVARMSGALEGAGNHGRPDSRRYARDRRRHAIVGSAICALAVAGCLAGPLIAWQVHGHPPMRTFLLMLPLYFLPAVTTVWVTGRRGARAIRHHQLWANIAFLAPAVASLWAEVLIFVCGRLTPLGPRKGELVGTGAAWMLILATIVIPAARRRRAALAAARPQRTAATLAVSLPAPPT
jgi:hypothetical protein